MLLWLSLLGAPHVDCAASVDAATCAAVEQACGDIAARLIEQGANLPSAAVEVVVMPSFAELLTKGHRSPFEVAVYRDHQILLAPPATLKKTPDLPAILRHECAHAWLRAAGVRPLPILLEETVAMLLAGQSGRLPPAAALDVEGQAHAARQAAHPKDRQALEHALAAAHATFGPRLLEAIKEHRLLAALKDP